jgi:eukaryotic-like serine/threonine-protein kinase
MRLPPGATLGPYEVVAPLGAGGMGEVYRSRDVRLGRQVALKLLLPDYAADDDRLRRFRLEAEAAGLLNHPNVVAVFDVGTHEGAPYVVSELLEGETLRQRLREGPVAPHKARDFALQIANGLVAAHDRGIVHRDLKPENVFLTRDGVVKLLDFGLAKLGADSDPLPGSQPGVVLGTAAYMSPEQARGRASDHRSDVFAFGAVLYEMVTGRRAFRGGSALETMSAVLREEPPWPPSSLPLTDGLLAVARRCLEKNPSRRYPTARALVAQFAGLGEGVLPPPVTATGRRTASVLAALALAAAAGYFAGARSPSPSSHLQRLTFRRGMVSAARFAPGGSLVYSAEWEGQGGQLYAATAGSRESRPLGIGPAQLLSISSAGEMALLLNPRHVRGYVYAGTLARAPLAGGVPRELVADVQAADWSPDGSELAVARDVDGYGRIEFPPGNVLFQTGGYPSHIRVSPDGQRVAFVDHALRSDGAGAIAVVDRAGRARTLSAGWLSIAGLAWGPSGREVWFTATREGTRRALWAVTLDGRERILQDTVGALTLHDVSGGRVLLAGEQLRREMVSRAPGEPSERNLSWLDWSRATHVSRDGARVLFSEQGDGGGRPPSVYYRGLDGSAAVRLGEGIANEFSPDGRWALVVQPGSPAQLAMLPVGPGRPRAITADAINHQWATWMPQGDAVVFSGNQPGHGVRLYLQPVDGGAPRPLTPEGVGIAWHPVSPDGRTVAAVGPDGRIALYSIGGGGPRALPGTEADDRPFRFTPNGAALLVFREGELPSAVHSIDLASGRRQLLRRLMPQDAAGVTQIHPTFMAADGASYLYSYRRVLSDLYLAEGVH